MSIPQAACKLVASVYRPLVGIAMPKPQICCYAELVFTLRWRCHMPAPNKSLIISQQLEPILAHIHPNIPLHLWISSSVLHEQTNADSVYAQLMHHQTRLRLVYAAGQGAQATHLEDSFDAWWEAQHIDICAMAERDVLLSISCPYEDEDFVFLSSVMFLNTQVEDAADVHAGAGLYAAWFNPNIAIETLAVSALLHLAQHTQTPILHLSGL